MLGLRAGRADHVSGRRSLLGPAQAEAKAGLKARVETELSAAQDDAALKEMRDRFSAEERALEHQIDHTVHTFSAALDVEYNVCARPLRCRLLVCSPARLLALAVPLQVSARAALAAPALESGRWRAVRASCF